MGARRIFSILLGILLIGLFGCRGAEIKMEDISCRTASAIPASATLNGKITIAWDINKEDKLAGYKIYYGLASRNYESCIDIGSPPESSASTLKYVLMDLESGKRYYIAVIAYDKKNNKSIFSNEVSAVAE